MPSFDLNNYVPVHNRLSSFYADNPTGRIQTTIIEHDRESGFVLVKAEIYRDAADTVPVATGHAFEERGQGHVNRTSYIENCETSATGRALALMGYSIDRGIASREEMQKVQRMNAAAPKVEKREGLYLVENRFKVTKPNGKIVCDCGKANCDHIAAVRAFAMSAN